MLVLILEKEAKITLKGYKFSENTVTTNVGVLKP
jgi:hypothetical protein